MMKIRLKKICSILLSAAMMLTMISGAEPVTASADTESSSSEKITGTALGYVYFGSYPQTEIVGEASQSGVYGRSWGIGNYTGTKAISLKITPKKAAVSKLTVGKKKLTVKMSTAVSKTGGSTYEIQYRIKGKSSWSKKISTKQSLTLTKLTKGKAYQVRVRAYKKVSGSTYYGSWSTVKNSGKVK